MISYASIVFAAAGALCFWLSGRWNWLLLIAPLLCYLRLWLNMLDGMVAIESARASKRGELVNDLPDRISDVLIFAGVAHSGLCNPFVAYWTAILALLTAYVGLFGQALGAGRRFEGIMSKPWRMVALHVGAWITFVLIYQNRSPQFGRVSVLDIACFVIITGCVQTIWVRLAHIIAALKR